jgi:GTP-binding protein HflX
VAFVGYTNAGKSTLFNTLTNSDVFAADMPFATLDPTHRDLELENGKSISLVDTVGFITDLPTHLIESFKATIEESIEADLLVHVRDISHPDTARQSEDVDLVLSQIETESKLERQPTIEVWNKFDALGVAQQEHMRELSEQDDNVFCTSALKAEGLDELLSGIISRVFAQTRLFSLSLSPGMGRERAWLFANCVVHEEQYQENGDVALEVEMSSKDLNHFVDLHDVFDPEIHIVGSRSL